MSKTNLTRRLIQTGLSIQQELADATTYFEISRLLTRDIVERLKFDAALFYQKRKEGVVLVAAYPEWLARELLKIKQSFVLPPACVLDNKTNWTPADCGPCGVCENLTVTAALRSRTISIDHEIDRVLLGYLSPAGGHLSSGIVLPLKARGKLFGVVSIHSRTRSRFREMEELVLSSIASSASLALGSAELWRQLKEMGHEENRGEMARDVVHTLNPNTASMLTRASMLRSAINEIDRSSGDRHSLRSKVTKAILRLDDLTDEIHNQHNVIKRYERVSERNRTEVSDVDLREIISHVLAINEVRTVTKDITIVERVTGRERPIHCVRMDLYLVIWNLMNNAIKFTRGSKPTKITISIAYEPSCVRLSIRDQGVGIREEHRADIWQLGFSTPAPDQQDGTTGVGLATVLNLVRNMDGDIQFNSKANHGSEFIVTIKQKEN